MPKTTTQTSEAREAGHTPGTWKLAAATKQCSTWKRVTDDTGKFICRIEGMDLNRSEDAANARLIAAAPALLEALIALEKAERISYAHLCGPQDRTPDEREAERLHVCEAAQKALAAIALATGESLNTQPSTLN